ncbi:hypothetical protein [Cellulosimicrobium sp. CUA-896]|uniref:hypothetical protein n=1 Tax=Cellulosimicrobium sp. CUA-896 TaxID=1517881 RepID=UPI000960CD55|nr:hypothetical protein [Cellulosimicrobium sp. CUA-896]OLT46111.1 hypothetical protein BJF88_04575 [Cellulosimicrobium sp. CUA-896]
MPGGAAAPPSNALRTDCRFTPAAAGAAAPCSDATETASHGASAPTTSSGVRGPSPGRVLVHAPGAPTSVAKVRTHSSSISGGTSPRTPDGGSTPPRDRWAGSGWIAASEIQGTSSDGPGQRAVVA